MPPEQVFTTSGSAATTSPVGRVFVNDSAVASTDAPRLLICVTTCVFPPSENVVSARIRLDIGTGAGVTVKVPFTLGAVVRLDVKSPDGIVFTPPDVARTFARIKQFLPTSIVAPVMANVLSPMAPLKVAPVQFVSVAASAITNPAGSVVEMAPPVMPTFALFVTTTSILDVRPSLMLEGLAVMAMLGAGAAVTVIGAVAATMVPRDDVTTPALNVAAPSREDLTVRPIVH